jgi:hypothetical protein
LLGALATWRASDSANRTAGNLALITLSQMYALIENIHRHLLVDEPTRAARLLGRPPVEFELRSAIGVDSTGLHMPADQLGFLVNSYDPDVLNRLMVIERAFTSMLDLLRRHEMLHRQLQEKMAAADPGPGFEVTVGGVARIVGMNLIMQIVDTVRGLQTGLPETRDNLLAVGDQLRNALRMQFPTRRFVQFIPVARDRPIHGLPEFTKPALWRRIVRWGVDTIRRSLGRGTRGGFAPAQAEQPQLPEIRRFNPPGMADPPR